MKIQLKSWTRLLAASCLTVGLISAVSCEEGIDLGDDAPLQQEDRQACMDFCQDARTCDDELDVQECSDTCIEGLQGCFEEQVDDAVAELRACMGADECLEVTDCSFEVTQECYFDFGLID